MARPAFAFDLDDPDTLENLRRYAAPPGPLDTPDDVSGDPSALGAMVPVPPIGAGTGNRFPELAGTSGTGLDMADLARRFIAARQQGEQEAWANHAGSVFDAAGRNILAGAGVNASPVVQERPGLADKPIQDLEAQTRLEMMARKSGKAATAKPGLNSDANSPEAKALQAAWKAAHPETPPEVLATLTPANLESWRKDFTSKAEIDARDRSTKAAGERQDKQIAATAEQNALSRSQKWAELRQQAELAGASADLKLWIAQQEIQAKKDEEAEKKQAKKDAVAVPGFEVAPGATPSVEDSKKVKDMAAARERMLPAISELRDLHRRVGLTLSGPDAEQENRLLTQLQIESKNIAGLGALSGPDYALMHAISTTDPTSIGSVLKQFFGVTDINKALDAMERWATNNLQGTAKALGYTPAAPGGSKRTRAPTDASGRVNLDAPTSSTGAPSQTSAPAPKYKPPPPGMKRVRFPGGQVRDIPANKLREALTRYNAVEVKE